MAEKAELGIVDDQEALISQTVERFTREEKSMLERGGIDPEAFALALLSYADYRRDERAMARAVLEDTASRLDRAGISWETVSRIGERLGEALCEQLGDKVGKTEVSRFYGGLMQAQAVMFQAGLSQEMEKQDRMRRVQREIERFPDTIAATVDPSTLAKSCLRKIKELVGAEQGAVFTVCRDGRLEHGIGDFEPEEKETAAISLADDVSRLLLEEGEPCLLREREGADLLRDFRARHGLPSLLMLPVVARGRTRAVIVLSGRSQQGCFDEEQVEIASSFASHMAVAMENAELHQKEQHKIKETVALLEIARAINSSLDIGDILDKAVRMTVDLCGVVQCVAYLVQSGRLLPRAYGGFINDVLWDSRDEAGFDLSCLDAEAKAALEHGRPVPLPVAEAGFLLPLEGLNEHGVDLVLIFPLLMRGRLTGILALFYPPLKGDLPREEMEVVEAIASQASMAVENAGLYDEIERSYFSTVKALARAIEVKDPYTHGHSERVTEYALMIADFMGLDERERQKLKYAATLHDIGKIGIAGKVLNKPGALTEEEYSHVKTHPHLGDSIVEPVQFLQGPRPIILHHHERYDGNGYPDGLKGSEIPIGARILSVADAFEAMRSDRPYRKALSLEVSRQELIRNSGSQFDPDIVRVFLDVLDSCGGDPVRR